MAERAYYRIEFPTAARPTLRIGGQTFVVIDCSEQGLRYRVDGGSGPTLGDLVDGVLTLQSGVMLDIAGSVVWSLGNEVGVYLDRGKIPMAAMMEEQRRLRARFRHLF